MERIPVAMGGALLNYKNGTVTAQLIIYILKKTQYLYRV